MKEEDEEDDASLVVVAVGTWAITEPNQPTSGELSKD
jgi:hypothetical protein